jgi:hypothetical protein
MEVELRDTADRETFNSNLQERLENVQADQMVTRLIVGHMLALIARREKLPKKLLDVLRASSFWDLAESIAQTSSEPEENERLHAKTREKHEQFFEGMNRVLS